MSGDVDFEVWISDRERVLLGDLVPGMELLHAAPTPDQIGRPLYGYLHKYDRLSWQVLAKMQASEVMLVPNVGPGRLNKILRLAKQLVAAQPHLVAAVKVKLDQVRQETLSDRVVDALVDLASWATASGIEGSVLDALAAAVVSDDPGVPVWALKVLADADLSLFADPARVVTYDPKVAATQLFFSLEVRHDMLLDRVLAVGRPSATLEQVGHVLGVTRERARQLAVELHTDIVEKVRTPEFHAVQAEAERFAERHGAAFPAEVVLQGRAADQLDNFERLVLMLAGPFRFDGEWFSRKEATPVGALVLNAFDQVQDHGSVALDDLVDLLGTLDVRSDYVHEALGLAPLRPVGDMVVDWRGSLAVKAIRFLHLRDEPMELAELAELVEAPAPASLTNQLSVNDQVHLVGLRRYALTEWDMESYAGIVPSMVAVLRAGPVGVDRLADDLHREFGASPNSVKILAGTHPAFLLEDGVVRLRPADQPYQPKTSLPASRDCFVVDGCWSFRIRVDHDLLRGSGRHLPEAFAVHLGLEPLGSGRVRTPVGSSLLRWGHYPTIGSLRLLGEHLDVEEGDFLFLRRSTPSSVDAVVVRQGDLPQDPGLRLRALVGSPGADGDLEQVLSDALGLRGTVNHDFTEERDALLERGESELVELLDQVMKGE